MIDLSKWESIRHKTPYNKYCLQLFFLTYLSEEGKNKEEVLERNKIRKQIYFDRLMSMGRS